MNGLVSDRTPVLVGVGLVDQRVSDATLAREPLELMVEAARAALQDSSAPKLAHRVEAVYVPRGRWRYHDPGHAIASRLGIRGAQSIMARVGVLQEQLIGSACERILEGEIDAALVVGGDAGYRLLRARIGGLDLEDSQQETEPDEVWQASNAIMTDLEIAGGLGKDAAPYYAVIDSAFRVRYAQELDAHRDALAELYSGFSRVAADNPHAWRRSPVEAAEVRDSSPRNPMLAFPYTKTHTSDWSVDQASALLFCSAGTAHELGVPPHRWVYPLASVVSNHMTPVTERSDLGRIPGAEIAARHMFDVTELRPDDLDLVELYSCFPVAVLGHAEALGLALDHPLSVSGGMRFAGGPFNNFVLHATGQVAGHLRTRPGATGLVSSVSGVLTKNAFSAWRTMPPADGGPSTAYSLVDVTDEVERMTRTRSVDPHYCGTGTIAGYTVVHDRGAPTRGVVVLDTPDGRRALAQTHDQRTVKRMIEVDVAGCSAEVEEGRIVTIAPESGTR